ncbi:G_PROTEIN_RECEP_F1_2 domain-containing protein [Caenorhabditis elegans]|uniref:G_PROTEIN_RECEP_F1_2 domain-containing protein n=1 Tax=Caenorhabditis elegans TaxID=6239 RepID=A0A3P6MYD2_CAEEL|nr:G_PROTEIN_RECEP_F1_2 domain-containing protein [Caenorhabditis elegans]VDJ66064.1 G_PROTEIN_RECEP_F1_2 domain-containing protein [Caenorhabditis elegans]|eukprot:NP_001355539.1 Uncharacterized protein CELE_D1079.1 [Caenorhabditis elegans]
MESDSSNYTLCDDTSQVRIAFFSIGTCLSALGCVFNGVLLYIFLGKTQRSYPFQTFLAFLDFMLCALYIHCFGLLSISVEYKIAFLYNFVMDSNVVTLVMSRIVQLSIPYTLIANSAEKLTMILGIDCESQFSLRLRIGVILLLLGTATSLRINGLYLYFIDEDENCDFYHRKWLSSHQEEQAKWIHFENVLTFFHTFVSFVLLCALNIVVVAKLRVQHRKTRRQSTSPAQLFSGDDARTDNQESQQEPIPPPEMSTTARVQAAQEIREQQHRLRCAVKTTVVIISAYLACNLVNFILYILETFRRSWIIEANGAFKPFYVIISDLGSNLFVFSSTIRIFIYYKYNHEIKKLIKDIWVVNYIIQQAQPPKADTLLKIDKVDV